MALGGAKENLSKNLHDKISNDDEPNVVISDDISGKNDHLSYQFIKNQDPLVNSSKKSFDGSVRCVGERKLNEFADGCVCERNTEDVNQSSDSLSSSASISDSDLTSTDSEDSLALSESESITDVTPLNSPYCDSPLPQTRHVEYKSDDKSVANACRNVDFDGSDGSCHRPEMNILMKAIEKLELEAKCNSELGFRENLMRRRATSLSNEEVKKVEQENQRLFKRVISQQNRIRSIYSSPNQPISKNLSYRHQELVKSDGDISVCCMALFSI